MIPESLEWYRNFCRKMIPQQVFLGDFYPRGFLFQHILLVSAHVFLLSAHVHVWCWFQFHSCKSKMQKIPVHNKFYKTRNALVQAINKTSMQSCNKHSFFDKLLRLGWEFLTCLEQAGHYVWPLRKCLWNFQSSFELYTYI